MKWSSKVHSQTQIHQSGAQSIILPDDDELIDYAEFKVDVLQHVSLSVAEVVNVQQIILLMMNLPSNAHTSLIFGILSLETVAHLDIEIMPNKAQEDAVINLKTLSEISAQLGFEWTVLAYELGFNRIQIGRFHTRSKERRVQARTMLESWYERTWDKPNKTKLLQDALERAGRLDLAERLRCLHWGHQKLSRRVELPSAFPFLITVHKTMRNQDALLKINDLNHRPF